MAELYSGKLSKKSTRKLFYNAEKDQETIAVFRGLENTKPVEKKVEIREEQPQIDPYESIKLRNMELDKARFDAALKSDSAQTLLKAPTRVDNKETVTLEQLPAIVRQATRAALIRRIKK